MSVITGAAEGEVLRGSGETGLLLRRHEVSVSGDAGGREHK